MRVHRHILISTFQTGFRLGVAALFLAQPGLGQPGTLNPASSPVPNPALHSRLAALLALPGKPAQVLQIRAHYAVVDFQQRVVQVGGDLKVLANLQRQAQQGATPIYDERLGITRAEFQRYIVFKSSLEPSGQMVKMALVRQGNRLNFGETPGATTQNGLGILKGLSIDLTTGELGTPDGFSARPQLFQLSAAQDTTGLGAANGMAWDVKGSNPRTLNALQGHLSMLRYDGGQTLLNYRRVAISKGSLSEGQVSVIFNK